MQKYGDVCDGNVYASKPGSLPCKMIIHAVGPRYKDGRHGEARALGNAVFESLKMAGENQFQSVAIPAISTGIFGYPLEAATQVILTAVMDYVMEGNHVPAEVHFVNNDEPTVNAFHEAVLQIFGKEKMQTVDAAGAGRDVAAPKQAWSDLVPKGMSEAEICFIAYFVSMDDKAFCFLQEMKSFPNALMHYMNVVMHSGISLLFLFFRRQTNTC